MTPGASTERSGAAGEPLLEVDRIDVSYDDVQVLYGLSLEVRRGEIVTLLGSNGAGKTTTLRAITGLVPPRAGEIRFRGQSLAGVPAAARAEHGIALVPEGRELWPQLTVLENLELGAYTRRARRNARQSLERMFALFPRLKERRRQAAGSLSGGEQQMCAIGRALMSGPKLVLLDEPSMGLAPVIVAQVFDLVRRLRAEGYTVLIVEQNVSQVLKIVDRAYLLEVGRIKTSGPAQELAASDEIRKAYMGI